MKKIIYIIFVVCLMLTGCTKEKSNDNQILDGEVIITPSSLYEENTKKLEPHLGMTTGCVKVEYKGDKEWIGVKYEIWEGGQLKSNKKLFETDINKGFNGEVSMSLKDIILDNLETSKSTHLTTVISDGNSSSTSKIYVDSPPESYGTSPFNIEERFKAKDNEEISIWGLMATDYENSGGSIRTTTLEATKKEADWAFIIKIFFKG